jgi:hypothetical protein
MDINAINHENLGGSFLLENPHYSAGNQTWYIMENISMIVP